MTKESNPIKREYNSLGHEKSTEHINVSATPTTVEHFIELVQAAGVDKSKTFALLVKFARARMQDFTSTK